MSNTTVPISEWCKEIRVALARKEMNLQSVADEIGYSYTTITALISGRIVKDNYLDIAKKINEVLEVNVLPEKPQLPSDEWCGAVRAKLYVKKMNISELSKSIGFNRDKVSLVLNGHALDWPVIEKINEQLGDDIDIQIKDIGSVIAGEAISKGDEITAGADGTAAKAKAGDYVLGIALSKVAKDGYARVQISKYQKNA